MLLAMVEEARARIEACLGWAMLLRISLCCKHPLTLVTQRHLAEELRLDWPLSLPWLRRGCAADRSRRQHRAP